MTLLDENKKLIKQNLRLIELYEKSEKQRLQEQSKFFDIISEKDKRIVELKRYLSSLEMKGFVCKV